ncbi:(S)-1-hydroxy-N-methylcanadine 13-hydroxylase CYP82X2-like [Actinidia eriantha]|uniref:(S)-1-hydroxy-N-methylcanadine 13-hydroxylase CYP82X2-like n=1 Tax=Actinidia eriantha TaxID=165200 RepID=UPI002584FDC3|nr:(S)-1-hydroxy-N-methylcanadine 13-hydroxylase CYP82X2-like [Actinidia eriantha]
MAYNNAKFAFSPYGLCEIRKIAKARATLQPPARLAPPRLRGRIEELDKRTLRTVGEERELYCGYEAVVQGSGRTRKKLQRYHIPLGTRLFINIWKLHRDPHVWSDQMEFRPERFLTTHNDVDAGGSISSCRRLGVG